MHERSRDTDVPRGHARGGAGPIREQLGPEAIIVRQREGIVGGIGGFFGKRCFEVEAEPPLPVPAAPKPMAMPATAITSAYTARDSATLELEPDHVDDIFGSLLDETSVFASTLAEAIEREPVPELEPELEAEPELEPELEPEPAFQPIAVEELAPGPPPPPIVVDAPAAAELARAEPVEQPVVITLSEALLDPKLAQRVVAEAMSQLRAFDPDEPFVNQVRETLARTIRTKRLNGDYRRRVIALVGPPGSGKTAAAARLCEAHLASGRRVAALSLEPLRQALELARLTQDLDVELAAADQPGLVEFAAQKLARAETVVVDAPGIDPGDEAGWATLAALLRPLRVHETHLVLPAALLPSDLDDFIGAASQALRVDRILLTHLDDLFSLGRPSLGRPSLGRPSLGPAVAAAIRAEIPISATATAERLVPADSHRLAAAILP